MRGQWTKVKGPARRDDNPFLNTLLNKGQHKLTNHFYPGSSRWVTRTLKLRSRAEMAEIFLDSNKATKTKKIKNKVFRLLNS